MHERKTPIYTPPGGPPQGTRPSPAIYESLGQEGVFWMLSELYTQLENSTARHLFPPDMQAASQRSAAFFVQLLGGPPLFSQTYGPPRMRQRHLPFEIDAQARKEWLACFERVLDDAEDRLQFPAEHLEGFREFLHGFSEWMVNVAPRD